MQYLVALLPFLASVAHASPIVKRANNQLIQSVTSGLCISPPFGADGVSQGLAGNDVNLVSLPCDQAAGWDISRGSGSIVLSTTNYAIDAGENPGDQGGLKLWQSYPGLFQQTWYYTDDDRLAITNGNQCITNTPSGPSYQPCATGNQDQAYRVYDAGSGPGPSSSSNPPPSSTSSQPSSTPTSFDILPNVPRGQASPPEAPGNGQRLHPYGRPDLCVTVQNGYVAEGAAVDVSYCFAENDPKREFQIWDVPSGKGNVALHSNPSLCLDAGNDPSNGSRLKVWSCGDGWLQQTWDILGIDLLALDNNQCLNVRKESQPGTQKPYNSVADLQTWECDRDGDRDPYQVFFRDVYPMN